MVPTEQLCRNTSWTPSCQVNRMRHFTASFVCGFLLVTSYNALANSYTDLFGDLSRLYKMQRLDSSLDQYYDDDLDSRSSDDWTIAYRDAAMDSPELFSGASIRDQEYAEQGPQLWGYQSVSGGTGDGKENPKMVKTDKVLPAYCNPPNPCPKGYTADKNCLENFENSGENNRRLLEEQDCPCDAEHMFQCPAGKKKITPKSEENAGLENMFKQIQNIEGQDMEQNPYLSTGKKRETLVAKKSPHFIRKRELEEPKENPYFEGIR
ncbi:hypothetical protein ScPMuIL_014719 [Solemya velum]